MRMENIIECGGFVFVHDFDSGNLGNVEQVPKEDIVSGLNYETNVTETPDYEFNIWTRPDCFGTEFENGNRTWFYFGIRSAPPSALVKLNLVNLNKQGKMYSQGMAPVTKTVPGKLNWERIKDKPYYFSDENSFTLSFKFHTPENVAATTYFAFTYPYTYTELQNSLEAFDKKFSATESTDDDDIYYCRECVCYSLEGRRVDLLTVSSRHGIMTKREEMLKNLFPDKKERPFKFLNKKVVFISARVHPGETPSSFVFNGFLNLILNRHDPVAIALRKLYVFKLIPFMNPDGVFRGHYRTDTRGVNLNRMYQMPSLELHPPVYAARALIRYYHFGCEKHDDVYDLNNDEKSIKDESVKSEVEDSQKFRTSNKKSIINNKFKSNENCLSNKNYSIASNQKKPQNTRKSKLPIDSEDDTSCSLVTNPTLVDQVEDLNISQSSVDTFNSNAMDDSECAMDNILNSSISSKTLQPDDYNIDDTHLTVDDDDDDDVLQGFSPLRQSQNNVKNHLNESFNDHNGSVIDSKSSSTPITLSACFRLSQPWCNNCKSTVKELESKMPGISQMLPIYKNEITNNLNANEKDLICINCHSSIFHNDSSKLNDNISNNKEDVVTDNNNKSLTEDESSKDSTISKEVKDVNKNQPKNKMDDKKNQNNKKSKSFSIYGRGLQKEKDSNLFLYIDLHGHASKKGIFMYGNHFDDVDNSVECMLLPRIMSLNNKHFHFTSCNFTERNMYLRDRRDGMSREGSGRVAVLKATGLMRSYTLECNYNTGRLVNVLPPTVRESVTAGPIPMSSTLNIPKYTPHLFEEVGKSLGSSILDLTSNHPYSRIPNSEHRNLPGIRDWLRQHIRHIKPSQIITTRQPTTSRTGISRTVRSLTRTSKTQNFMDPERKENLAGPGYQIDSRVASSRAGMSSTSRSTSSGIKLLPIRLRGEQTLTSKAQRNLSLISIKKSSTSKHPPTYKTPSRNRSPGPKLRFNAKPKIAEDTMVKDTIRSLMESNRTNSSKQVFKPKSHKGNFKNHKETNIQKQNTEIPTTSFTHRKVKTRSKESLYQKQPGQFTAKPLTKRLKMSQYIKYLDNTKEKYRICKNTPQNKKINELESTSSPISSSGEDMILSWNPLRVQKVANNGGPGTSSNTQNIGKCPQRTTFKSRRPAFHHIPPTTPDLGTIRNKYI